MKATLVRHEKFTYRRRFIIEISVHQVPKSPHYVDGLKWGLICIDQVTNRRVLMDNHRPKGPHIHIDSDEMPYKFRDLDKLISDFRQLIAEHLGVQI